MKQGKGDTIKKIKRKKFTKMKKPNQGLKNKKK